MMVDDWINGLLGGALIGLAATAMLVLHGRIAGVSGIFFGALRPRAGDWLWRFAFLLGLVAAGVVVAWVNPGALANETERPWPLIALAGLAVGYGTRLGSGCTSGHGVCGISRLSVRSLVATAVFIGSGIVTVLLLRLAGL